jgi:hypothetical protein
MKKDLMILANKLRKKLGMSLALKKAWKIIKLRMASINEPVRFKFEKVSGEIKSALGFVGGFVVTSKGINILYLTEEGTRSFKAENLIG